VVRSRRIQVRYYIITGTSRGIGQALAEAIIEKGKGHTLFCISRGGSDYLEQLVSGAGEAAAIVHDIRFDLAKTGEIDDLVERIFRGIDAENCEELFLVNNAGVLEPIGPAGHNSTAVVEQHIRVNLLAPMRLTSLCIAAAEKAGLACRKVALAISSGAATRPYHGWSAYCTGKAGLQMFSRTVALEQQSAEHPFISVALSPGIIETRMQELIRRSDPANFPDRDKFVHYRDAGHLDNPGDTAKGILALLEDPALENGAVLDLRELQRTSSS
jgi:benzil reductase ((S)-benzoin forming)